MPLYRPQELQAFLQQTGTRPLKALSQNFLVDGNILNKIIDLSGVEKGDLVIEVGPGPGVLTEALVEKGCRVIAIEKDRAFANHLDRFEGVEVFHEDALKVDFQALIERYQIKGEKAKFLSNLPYHLTTPILTRVFPLHELIESVTVMVQDEFADRMIAAAGSDHFSHLTLLTQFYSEAKKAFKVSRRSFYPVPKIDSAVMHLSLHQPPLEGEHQILFFEMTRHCFQHRRKMFLPLLKEHGISQEVLEALAAHFQIDLRARIELFSLDQLLSFYRFIAKI
jgi:16S rRNA (adenine1518-N6/adenine1519-N6)-dimethyltransferase